MNLRMGIARLVASFAAMAFVALAAVSVAEPPLEWKSPFEGPCVNVHEHFNAPADVDRDALFKEFEPLVENQVIMMLITGVDGIPLIQELMAKYPGYVYGLGSVVPDQPGALERIEAFHKADYRGLKFIRTNKNYSDPEYHPVFAKAAEYGMTCVFHTNTTEYDLRDHPVHIDQLLRDTPGLKAIGYHLANPNFEVAGELMLKNTNIFFDASGITWRMIEEHYLGPEAGREMILNKLRMALWHPQMWSQLAFGTDGSIGGGRPNSAELVLKRKDYYRDWMTTLNVPEEIQYKVMYDNAAMLFHLPERPGAKKEETKNVAN